MASTSANPMDMIKKELTCSICLNLLQEPKDLDCPHSYCFHCLKQYVKRESTIECPECRYVTIVPHGGLKKLKSNLRLKNMVESFDKDAGAKCSKRQKLMVAIPMCPDHIGERQHFFCNTCTVSVCHNCLVLKHPKPRHEIREIKDVLEEEEKERRQKLKEVKDVKRKLKAAKEKSELQVKARAQRVICGVKAWERKMNEDIEETYRKCVKILDRKKIELNRSIINGTRKHDQHSDALPHDMTILALNPGQVNFSNYGELVTFDITNPGTSKQVHVGLASKEAKLAHAKTIDRFHDAISVAAIQSNIIGIADSSNNHISVYGKLDLSIKDAYVYQTLFMLSTTPYSIAMSSKGKFFVSDGGIMKMFSTHGKYEGSWVKPVAGDAIAVTPNDMVVIGSRSGYVITVHKSDGEVVRTHRIVCEHFNTIASNGKHIACTTQSPDMVCVIDFITGQTLWSLNMTNQYGICYEPVSNTLLVSRGSWPSGHGTIEQYCSTTGRHISRLASDLRSPQGMTVTKDNKLVVADSNSVKIYHIN